MKLLRTALAFIAATTMLFTLGAVTARADVYTEPGGQIIGDRLWRTDCGMYSSSVVRCRTEIYATVVKYQGGKYVRVTDWAFNNLTYLPSPKAQWSSNPLAIPGAWTAADGRQWRTECNTAATGADACRSYAMVKVAKATWNGSMWVYSSANQWVFNNIVQFSTATRPAVAAVPPSILDKAKLSHKGFGPLKTGTSLADLAKLGYVRHTASDVCEYYEVSPAVAAKGIQIVAAGDKLQVVIATTDAVETTLGIKVGQPYTQANTMYSAAGYSWQHQTKSGYQPVYVYRIEEGANEMLFLDSFEAMALPDSSGPIGMIIVRETAPELMWDGC